MREGDIESVTHTHSAFADHLVSPLLRSPPPSSHPSIHRPCPIYLHCVPVAWQKKGGREAMHTHHSCGLLTHARPRPPSPTTSPSPTVLAELSRVLQLHRALRCSLFPLIWGKCAPPVIRVLPSHSAIYFPLNAPAMLTYLFGIACLFRMGSRQNDDNKIMPMSGHSFLPK